MAEQQPQELEGLHYLKELPQARPHIHETRRFPTGFLWGASTSAFQVEGGCDKCDWADWEKMPGHIVDGTVTGQCTDHYNRYEEDFELAKSLHHNAQRLGIEWSRIEPQDGVWDLDEVIHYRRVLQSLRRRGMKTMVTIWHFTLPKWFAAQGGWEAGDAVEKYRRYVAFIARELGDLVDFWNTMNEPNIYLVQAYGAGGWPPGVRGLARLIHVFGKLCRAHMAAYRTLHAELDGRGRAVEVGAVMNIITYEPYRRYSITDNVFIYIADRLFNRQFYIWTPKTHDFIGINYYFHYRVRYVPNRAAQFFYEVHTENREVSDLGWEINAAAIFDAIMSVTRYGKPIYITEHGVANADDAKRPRLIINGVKEIYHAIQAGADVRGYFHWSLLDNFEWEKGFSGRFGLIAVDYQTLKRTPRRSAYVYADICRENGLPHYLLHFVGHGVRW